MIVTSSGKNVYPDELEPLFSTHEYISELSIVGIPDPQGDGRVAALIVLNEDVPQNARSDVKAHITSFKSRLSLPLSLLSSSDVFFVRVNVLEPRFKYGLSPNNIFFCMFISSFNILTKGSS